MAIDSRANTELRGDCPRKITDVLDAVAVARNRTRMSIAIEVLGKWADEVIHESTLVMRVTGVNPDVPEPYRKRPE